MSVTRRLSDSNQFRVPVMARQRVVLVNPPALAIVEPWYDRPDWGRIGLAYLAGWLKRDPDVEVVVVDAKLERLSFEQVQARVAALEADVVGFTAFTNEIKPAAYTASLIKDLLPKAVTVIGGVHVTALPRQTIEEFSSFDVAVIGEGERTLEELCSAIRRGEDWSDVAGLVYRSDLATPDGLVQTIARPRMLDQDLLPLPAWDLFPPMKSFWLQTVRGCPFNCVFCMNHNGRIARSRSVQNVVAEIRWLLDEHGIGDLRFGDELFTVDMDRSRELMEALIESGLSERIRWDCQTHVRFVDESLLRLMKQAGCYRVELGIETGDEEKLRSLGKGTNLKMILAAAEAARRAGLSFGTFFIIGQPDENRDSIRKTVDLAVRMNPDLPMIGLMCPYPGTEVGRMAAQGEGGYRLVTTDWDEYNKQVGGAMEFAGMTRNQLEWIQLRAYLAVYVKNWRFWGFVKFAWEFRTGAWQALKKALFRRSMSDTLPRPEDYESRLSGGRAATFEDVVSSRIDWEEVQKSELKRGKSAAREATAASDQPSSVTVADGVPDVSGPGE